MPRMPATLPEGVRITDHISLGVIAKTFPRETVDEVLDETGRSSERERSLPAHVMVYYVIAMALHMQVAYREGGETHVADVQRLFLLSRGNCCTGPCYAS